MKENIYKPVIRVDGIKDYCHINWHRMTIIPETNSSGRIHFIIMTDKERINLWENSIPEVERYAKQKTVVKGNKAVTFGRVRILVRGIDGTEQLVATVDKERHKSYTIIDKPEKRRKL